MCEGKDFDKAQCLEVGCCHWNDWEFEDGKCFSSVGNGKCIKGKYEHFFVEMVSEW